MTVIAFDGKILAADRQATTGTGGMEPVTKIRRAPNGDLCAVEGCAVDILRLLDWYCGGCKTEFPKEVDEASTLWVVKTKEQVVLCFEHGAVPLRIERFEFTAGNGGRIALGAMAMGANARRAAWLACEHNAFCGMGIDTLGVETVEAL